MLLHSCPPATFSSSSFSSTHTQGRKKREEQREKVCWEKRREDIISLINPSVPGVDYLFVLMGLTWKKVRLTGDDNDMS